MRGTAVIEEMIRPTATQTRPMRKGLLALGGRCTLRAAIEEANDTAGDDTINFNIGGTGAGKTISPSSALPTITDTITIDGYTQTGASPSTLDEGKTMRFST
jgi:hypothetical protein